MVIFIGIAWGVMFLLHVVAYVPIARAFHISVPYWPLVLAVVSFSYFLASMGVRLMGGKLADLFYFVAAAWLGVVFLLFSVMALYSLVYVATRQDYPMVVAGLLVLVAGLSVYALMAGRSLVTREYTIPIKNIVEPVTIVHVSDIHIGTVHQEKFLERVVALTNEAKPDLVLVTGDLFDGSAPVYPEMLQALDTLTAPSYFSHGNHEEYEGLGLVKETVKDLDMQLLENQLVEWRGLQIVGVNDRQSLRNTSLDAVLSGLPLDATKPTILMYHTPSDWEMARAHGVDVMLSGHTHNGQIYPFTLLVRLAFPYINGLYEEAGKYLHVTPGTGTWGPPMRLGSRNQVTVLRLEPLVQN